ncbi:type IV pilus biogenesis protein PilM [Chloroflexota bacterium]
MFGNNSPVVTLNIEPDGARLLQVRGRKVESWRSVSFTADKMNDITTVDADALAEVLKDLFRSVKPAKTEVLLGITGIRSVYRIVVIPNVKSLKVEEAIRWVAAREIPLNIDEVNLSWHELSKSKQERRVFLLATPKKILESVEAVLARAKIKHKSVDLKPLALARFVNKPEAIIVDMEGGSATIVVIRNGEPRVMHTIVVKRDLAVADRVQRISNDLLRTMQFYNNAHPQDPVTTSTNAFITGKLADSPDMIQMVADSIPYPLGEPRQCLEYPNDFPPFEYAVNIGLALRERSVSKGNKEYESGQCSINVGLMAYADRG